MELLHLDNFHGIWDILVYRDLNAVVLRQGDPDRELVDVKSVKELRQGDDGLLYDSKGIFPRFTADENKEVVAFVESTAGTLVG